VRCHIVCPSCTSPQGLPANLAGQFGGMQMAAGLPSQQQLMAAGAIQQQQQLLQVYDPMGGLDVAKLNAFYMQRQHPALAGGFIRPVG
jgi:hypothetical protein